MSTNRNIFKAPFDGPEHRKARGPNGRKLCRWCGVEVPKGRQTWCSQPCVDEFLIRKDPNTARRRVLERDRGVCALCGLDTLELERWLGRLGAPHHEPYMGKTWKVDRSRFCGRSTTQRYNWQRKLYEPEHCDCRYHRAVRDLRRRGWHDVHTRALWDADHIKPVIEGGGGCPLENLRTLCVPCHKTETAKLAARRAVARRPQMKLEL